MCVYPRLIFAIARLAFCAARAASACACWAARTVSWRLAALACARLCSSCAASCALTVCNFSAASVEEEPVLNRTCWRARSRVFCSALASHSRDTRFRSLHIGGLQFRLRLQGFDLRRGRRHAGSELVDGGTVVVIDDFGDHLALVHPLIVLYGHAAHVTRDLRGNRREVGLQVSVIRGLPPRIGFPAVPARRDEHQHAHGEQKDDRPPDPVRRRTPMECGPLVSVIEFSVQAPIAGLRPAV